MADNQPVKNQNPLRVALVGRGIQASLTPAMHEAEGRAQGLDYTYSLIDTETATHKTRRLSEIVTQALNDGLVGLNITHPYKTEIMQHLDDMSEDARKLGAVNTVLFDRHGRKTGHNTDYSGFRRGFQSQFGGVSTSRVLLLGAGGAGAAVAFALMDCGVQSLFIYDTDHDRSARLTQNLRAYYPNADINAVHTLDSSLASSLCGLVNASPMGMQKNLGSAFPLSLLSLGHWVADIVYFPLETRLLNAAVTLGCRVMPGSVMAIWQAVHAFEFFTGLGADPDRFNETFARLAPQKRYK